MESDPSTADLRTQPSRLRSGWLVPVQPPLQPLSAGRALLGFALCFALPLAIAYVSRLFPGARLHPLVMVSAGTTAVMLAYLLLVRTHEWRQVVELGMRPLPRELGFGLALGAITCAGIVGGSLVLQALNGEAAGAAAEAVSMDDALRAFVLSRQSAVIEEIAFRGLLLRWLWGRLGADRGVVLQALVFGAAHYPQGGLPHAILATVMGLAFGYAFLWRRSLWTPIGLHMAWDVLALLPRGAGTDMPDTLVFYGWLIVVGLLLTWPLRRWALEWGDHPPDPSA